jgi:predicted HNH restriction endonuclease
LVQSTWLPVCRNCHDWIHANPGEARIMGWLK